MVTAAIGAIAALGSAIYGGIKSSQANKRAEELIAKQRADNKRWYDIKMAQDYTQRADVQAAIKRQREMLNEQYENARRSQAVTGATDEAVALQQQAANNSLSQTMTDVASQSSSYKDSVEQQYRAQDAALNQQQVVSNQQQAAQAAQAASQAVNAGANLVGMGVSEMGTKSIVEEAAVQQPDNSQVSAETKKKL